MPDQMMLQIHESIGHPLELDRILGDERNYAGTSFVTLDMFGSYRYGSELLNVTFDPTRAEEFASYAFDDDGTPAEQRVPDPRRRARAPARRQHLAGARGGIAGRRQHARRAAGTARRSTAWRTSTSSRATRASRSIVAAIERGVLMRTNVSWSIDDSRNKFQFGCEWGRVIQNGKLAEVVKNPNYRGISATFWRSLEAVGDARHVRGAWARRTAARASRTRRSASAMRRRPACSAPSTSSERRAMRTPFDDAGGRRLRPARRGREVLLLNFNGEDSDFVRFNNGARAPGESVRQRQLDAAADRRTAPCRARRRRSPGEPDADRAAVGAGARRAARRAADAARGSATCCTARTRCSRSASSAAGCRMPRRRSATWSTRARAVGRTRGSDDLVGFLASGPDLSRLRQLARQRHWHEVDAFNFDWCLYHAADKAVKTCYAGSTGIATSCCARVALARGQLARSGAPPRRPSPPGEYRAYLAPAALDEFLGMLNWSGVSARSQRTKQSCISCACVEGDAELSPQRHVREHTAGGLAPAFDEFGFAKPDAVHADRGRPSRRQPRVAALGARVRPRRQRRRTRGEMPRCRSTPAAGLAERDVLERSTPASTSATSGT